MDNYSIATLMKKQDKSFSEELTFQDKQIAFRKFKKLYAEQMAKLSIQISRKQRIQENLAQISEQQVTKAKSIDEQIKKKMEKHIQNKNKHDNNLQKEVKMLEENWKRKMDEINQKKRQKDKEAFRKAQKIRRDAEQYFSKKKSMTARQTIVVPAQKTPEKNQKHYLNVPNNQKYSNQQQIDNKNFNYTKTEQKKITFMLPNLKNTKIKLNKKDFEEMNKSKNDLKKEQDIKLHLERNQRVNKQRQQANFQRMLQKLEKIEATRKIANQKLQKEVEQAKKMRQLRESPQVHAANRQKSIQSLHSKSKKKLKQKRNQQAQALKLSASKSRISESLQKHLENKRKIVEYQFNERQNAYEAKIQKLKQGKINRLLKSAINQIKQKTLSERQ